MIPGWLTDTVTSDLDRAVHYTLLWGLEAVELRTVGGKSSRVPFVNEERVRRRLEENELPVLGIVPGLFESAAEDVVGWMNEVAAFEETLTFCKRIGCTRVIASAFQQTPEWSQEKAVNALREIGKHASRNGITVAVLNEIDMAVSTGTELSALIREVNLPSVRAAWDPAAAVWSGEAAVTGLQALNGLVDYVRCADVRTDRKGGRTFVPMGDGQVNWPEQLRTLHQAGYDGPLSLELFVDPKPKWGLQDSEYLIRLIREVRRSK